MRPKVLVLASYAPSLINFRGPLLRALVGQGYRVIACGPHCEETSAALQASGIEYLTVAGQRSAINPFSDVLYCLRLIVLFRKVKPSAIISYTAKPVVWGSLAAAIAGVQRKFAIITGLGSVMITGSKWRSPVKSILERLYRIALMACERVAFQNPDDEAEFLSRRLVDESKTFLVNGSGVQLEHYKPVPVPSNSVFLLIARLLADKGIREYVEAARRVKSRYPSARFRLAGWFDSNPTALRPEEVDEWVRKGVIEYVGPLKDVRVEIANAMVYVLPSYREGTPRTVLEAMSMGRPIITSNAPGCRETVRNGWNGFLVEPKSADALAEAMERIMQNPASAVAMGARSRELAVGKYDARTVAAQLMKGFGLWAQNVRSMS